jgi:Lar family restriction alleviation protein
MTNKDPAPVSQEALLPCPFCGGEAREAVVYADSVTIFTVECSLCEAERASDESAAEARGFWNTRATPEQPSGGERAHASYDMICDVLYVNLFSPPMVSNRSTETTMRVVVRKNETGVVGVTITDFVEQAEKLATPPTAEHEARAREMLAKHRCTGVWLQPDGYYAGECACGASFREPEKRLFNLAWADHALSALAASAGPEVERLREALELAWSWPCPEGGGHCCCECDECCDCGWPVSIEPDWTSAETCIGNALDAYANASTHSEDGPVDTVVSSGDLYVILSLAGAAFHARRALSRPASEGEA